MSLPACADQRLLLMEDKAARKVMHALNKIIMVGEEMNEEELVEYRDGLADLHALASKYDKEYYFYSPGDRYLEDILMMSESDEEDE